MSTSRDMCHTKHDSQPSGISNAAEQCSVASDHRNVHVAVFRHHVGSRSAVASEPRQHLGILQASHLSL